MHLILRLACLLFFCPLALCAQTVQPTIMEYGTKADGRFAVTNNTNDPMTVVIEPKSFSIAPDGRGTFRALDRGIKVELSTMSVKLQPMQTYWVFYKASAEKYPAWFTVYSSFTGIHRGAALQVRFMLPHTVYLYQKEALAQGSVEVTKVKYLVQQKKLVVDLENKGTALGRVQEVQLSGPRGDPAVMAGFPLLPGLHRHLEIPWENDAPPTNLRIRFDHFTLRPALEYDAETSGRVRADSDRSRTGYE
jgi:hypothetical protein